MHLTCNCKKQNLIKTFIKQSYTIREFHNSENQWTLKQILKMKGKKTLLTQGSNWGVQLGRSRHETWRRVEQWKAFQVSKLFSAPLVTVSKLLKTLSHFLAWKVMQPWEMFFTHAHYKSVPLFVFRFVWVSINSNPCH